MSDTIDSALVHRVAGFAQSRLNNPYSPEGLSELESDVLATVTGVGLIESGGFLHWFAGMDGRETLRVAAAFDRMGLGRHAELMRESLSAFPDALPSPNLKERQQHLSGNGERLKKAFGPLEQEFWDRDAGYYVTAAKYVHRRRSELLALDPAFSPILQEFEQANRARTERLRAAAAVLAPAARADCERAIDSEELGAALEQIVRTAGNQPEAFWRDLADVARELGQKERAGQCEGWGRIAVRGALHVAVEWVPAGELRSGQDRVHRTGDEVSWNVGAAPAEGSRSARAELFLGDQSCARPGDHSRLFLVPADERTLVGAQLVLHDGGEVVGRGHVLERLSPVG